ncbi:MAG: serpin family protein [Planctomyces sp.]|nr:serpin family protein [Planctomyces sp.]
MLRCSMFVLVTCLCLGCGPATEVNRRVAEIGRKPPEPSTEEVRPYDEAPILVLNHLIPDETEYYNTAPGQQGQPADGTFAAGTRVGILKEAGQYVIVRTYSGIEGFVVADAVKLSNISAADVSGLVKGCNQFALELYQQLRSGDENLFFSPTSISVALAMTYAGAAGDTQAEMASTLHFDMPNTQFHESMHAFQGFWASPDKVNGIRLKLANRLWGQRDYQFLPAFRDLTRDKYAAELVQLDFADSENSRQTINTWVEEQTEQKIVDLIPDGLLSSDTRLVLTNAVYFQGNWADQFEKENTRDEDFQLNTKAKVKVPMMHRTGKCRYSAIDNLQVLELPYGDGSLSMIVLLPKTVDGLEGLETQLNFENLQRWMQSVKPDDRLEISLPRFKITAEFDLKRTLQAMGMKSAFEVKGADFSGMTGDRNLFISGVVHKAFVDVNEEGTEAAAATGVIATIVSMPPTFRADHPFVFMIRDNRNGALLFVGKITNPAVDPGIR